MIPFEDRLCLLTCAKAWRAYDYQRGVLSGDVTSSHPSDSYTWKMAKDEAKIAGFETAAMVWAIETALGIPGGTWGGGASSNGSSGDSGSNVGAPTGVVALGTGKQPEGALSEFLAAVQAGGALPDFLKFFAD